MEEIKINNQRARKHIASNIYITEDGKYVEVRYIDSKTGQEKSFSPEIRTDLSGRRYIKGLKHTIHYCDEMVAVCFLPKPLSGQVLVHKDGNIANDHRKNLTWETPVAIPSTPRTVIYPVSTGSTLDQVTLPNGLTVTKGGKVYENGQILEVREYKFNPYTGMKYGCPPYVVYHSDGGSGKKEKALNVDNLMSQANFIKGDRNSLQSPVILHKDNDPMNFDSDNLEWVEQSDPRYVTYKSIKQNGMN